MKLKCDKTSEIVREMTDSEKAESIIKLINDYDINSTFLFGWQIEFIEKLCKKQLNNGWIPCSERLPEVFDENTSETVLITDGNWMAMGFVNNNQQWLFAECSNKGADIDWTDITAWQPLPEKYKEVSE